MGRAINKTVMITELIKVRGSISLCRKLVGLFSCYCDRSVYLFQRRIVGLHQNTQVGSTDITDTWEPLEEGLLP